MRCRPAWTAVHQEQQLVHELAQRHHVGQVHQGDERDGDGPQPSRTRGDKRGLPINSAAARTPSSGGDRAPAARVPRSACRAARSTEPRLWPPPSWPASEARSSPVRPIRPRPDGPRPSRPPSAGVPLPVAPRGGVSLLGHRPPRYPGDLHRSVTLRASPHPASLHERETPRPYPWVRTVPAEVAGQVTVPVKGAIAMTHHADVATTPDRGAADARPDA